MDLPSDSFVLRSKRPQVQILPGVLCKCKGINDLKHDAGYVVLVEFSDVASFYSQI